jgi:hypothetical protein
MSPGAPEAPGPPGGFSSGQGFPGGQMPSGMPSSGFSGMSMGPTTPPSFYGMAPMPTHVRMPSAYGPISPTNVSPARSDGEDEDLAGSTAAAVQEWNAMYATLRSLESQFGPAFEPLPSDLNYTSTTPFGQPLLFPSYDIAVIWGMYYMIHIVALRGHPHMPPAALMAAGVAAGQTAGYSQLIGRIAAGMMPDPLSEPLNPSVGATYSEIALCLFFAGIQFTDTGQRIWLVTRLRQLEQLTGWASVGMIAHGCETSWEKAAASGRGPPYQRLKPHNRGARPESRSPGSDLHGQLPVRTRPGQRPGTEEVREDDEVDDLRDRKYAATNPGTRVHWAMGLLGGEDDLRKEKEADFE